MFAHMGFSFTVIQFFLSLCSSLLKWNLPYCIASWGFETFSFIFTERSHLKAFPEPQKRFRLELLKNPASTETFRRDYWISVHAYRIVVVC